jgi:hypothetical protein
LARVEGSNADDPRMRLVRTIGQDDALARLLVRELTERIPDLMPLETLRAGTGSPLLQAHASLRGICEILRFSKFLPPRRERVRVALVAQQDTDYGRFWMQTMEGTIAPLAFLLVCALARTSEATASRIGTLVVGSSLIHTLPWVLANAGLTGGAS